MATTLTKLFPPGILQSAVELDEIALQDTPPVTGLHYLITFYNNNFRLNFIEQSSWVNFTAQMNIGDAVYATHGSSGRLYYGVITAFDNSAGGPGPNPNVTNPLGHPDFFGTYDGQSTYFEVGGLTNFAGVRVSPNGLYARQFDEVSISTGTAERKTSTGTYMVGGYFNEITLSPSNITSQSTNDVSTSTSFVVPSGVTRISAVVIGGGGQGAASINSGNSTSGAGGGGGLSWKNNIPVTPGETLTVVVGAGGSIGSNYIGEDGAASYIARGGTTLLLANGGKGGVGNNGIRPNWEWLGGLGGTGGASVDASYGGGNGGRGGNGTIGSTNYRAGGGGAGGYSGNGGTGGNAGGSYNPGSAGSGGGGGGGASTPGAPYSGGGGGTGVNGEGTSGAGGGVTTILADSINGCGKGGSGGDTGGSGGYPEAVGTIRMSGGRFGGGGAGSDGGLRGNGAPGAVRIIWGLGREFPASDTGDQ